MEQPKTRGGAREGAGAKPKAETQKSNSIFLLAIREAKNVDNDDDARKAFATELLSFERGKMFIAEHLFGKPKETVENINKNIEVSDLTPEEILRIKENINSAY